MKYNFDYSNLKDNELIMLQYLGSFVFIDKNGDDISVSDIDKAQDYVYDYIQQHGNVRIFQDVLRASVRVGGIILYKFSTVSNCFVPSEWGFIKPSSFVDAFKGEYVIYDGVIK